MKVKDVIEKLSKYNPESTLRIWDGGNFYEVDWVFDVLPAKIDYDGTPYQEIVSLELDQTFDDYWWVPTKLTADEKMKWVREIMDA